MELWCFGDPRLHLRRTGLGGKETYAMHVEDTRGAVCAHMGRELDGEWGGSAAVCTRQRYLQAAIMRKEVSCVVCGGIELPLQRRGGSTESLCAGDPFAGLVECVV